MVKGKNLPGVPELEEPVGYLRIDAGDNKWTCLSDGVAYDMHGRGDLLAASIAGGTTEIRAWRAALLTSEAKVGVVWQATGGREIHLGKDDAGYHVHCAPLGMGAYHLVALSRRDDLLPCMAEEAVWRNLVKRTTTPLRRDWIPLLVEKLMKDKLLAPATAHGRMSPGLLRITTEALDALVSKALRAERLKIVA